jgi:hypothetical protein
VDFEQSEEADKVFEVANATAIPTNGFMFLFLITSHIIIFPCGKKSKNLYIPYDEGVLKACGTCPVLNYRLR